MESGEGPRGLGSLLRVPSEWGTGASTAPEAAGEIGADREAGSEPPVWMCCVTTAARDMATGAQRCVLTAVTTEVSVSHTRIPTARTHLRK